jgi:hypothetical protein
MCGDWLRQSGAIGKSEWNASSAVLLEQRDAHLPVQVLLIREHCGSGFDTRRLHWRRTTAQRPGCAARDFHRFHTFSYGWQST